MRSRLAHPKGPEGIGLKGRKDVLTRGKFGEGHPLVGRWAYCAIFVASVVLVLFLLLAEKRYTINLQTTNTLLNSSPDVGEKDAPEYTKPVNHQYCVEAIHRVVNPLIPSVPTMLSTESRENVRDLMIKAVLDPDLIGDWIETGTWRGGASLIAATVLKTAMETSSCGNVHRRDIWLADSFEGLPPEASQEGNSQGYDLNMDKPGSYAFAGGIDSVKEMFRKKGFSVDGSPGIVRVHFLKGWFSDTLPDAPIGDIAVLRLDGDMYLSTLQALFALYRRVQQNGYIIIGGYGNRPQCKKAIDTFFMDAAITLNKIDDTGRWFQKENVHVRVPPDWNQQVKQDPLVDKAFGKLDAWFKEIPKKFVGNVRDNQFQTQRYVEALRHILFKTNKSKTIVCETGFNGGHSAMMFMALNELRHGEGALPQVHYFGWDLGTVTAARPIAKKMEEAYPGQFKVIWGDTKVTMKSIDGDLRSEQCDVIIIDGEHSFPGVSNDLQALLSHAASGACVFVDDCAVPNTGIVKAFDESVQDGRLLEVARYRNPQLGSPGFAEGVVPDKSAETRAGPY